MENVYLSKSKYCRAKQCNKMLWLDKNKPEEAMTLNKDIVLETGTRVGNLAKNYFGEYVDIEFNKSLSKMIEQTEKELKKTIYYFVSDYDTCRTGLVIQGA